MKWYRTGNLWPVLRARHAVYCIRRELIPPFPDGLETDEYDADSIHLVAESDGHIAATARLITDRLPLFSRFDGERKEPSAELSRVISFTPEAWPVLCEAVDQTARKEKIQYLYAAMTPALRRRARGYPWRQIGPEIDYLGPVVPYELGLD